jgi:sortase A
VASGFGELLITAGVLLLLFCIYQLFYSNVTADRAQHAVAGKLRERWSAPAVVRADEGRPAPGDAFALIRIPRLGSDWVKPVVQGVAPEELAKGVGHYPGSALPGQVGNFAVAGHRATHGEPFRDLNRVRAGDTVVVETRRAVYTYRVDSREIVLPAAVEVVDPVPHRPGVRPTRRLITLTTCNPRWASYQRLIVYGHLVSTQAKPA